LNELNHVDPVIPTKMAWLLRRMIRFNPARRISLDEIDLEIFDENYGKSAIRNCARSGVLSTFPRLPGIGGLVGIRNAPSFGILFGREREDDPRREPHMAPDRIN
jgi:hypothetical protein